MALDPQYLDSLPQTLVNMYSLVEIDILEDMARRISTYDFFIPAALHQNQKLQELGLTQQHIIEALAGMTGQTQGEIVDLLTEASEVAIEDDTEYYKAADVYKPEEINTEALHKQLNSGLLQTQQAFKNITRTTANTATKQFENALDRAWTQINVGGMDYNTAIHNAIKDLSKAGVGAIAYKSGRVDSIEVAVRRAVVTGANQTAAKTQEVLADELGVDLVEVTAHGGARPEHAKWQGKVYSRKGRKVIDGVVYEDFEKATRYGHGDGLGGWNCRHTFHPYIHGAPRTWSDKQIKDLDKKNITYNGETYSEYEASQIQRGIERDIRSLKRQVAAIEAGGGDASAERSQLRKAQKAYTDFTEQTGLKKQTARTKVATGTGTEKPAPNTPTTGNDELTERRRQRQAEAQARAAERAQAQQQAEQPKEEPKRADSDFLAKVKARTTPTATIEQYEDTLPQTIEQYKQAGLFDKSLDNKFTAAIQGGEYLAAKKVIYDAGYAEKPLVLSKADYAKLPEDDYIFTYRGVKNAGGITAAEINEQFRSGDLYIGNGAFGNGTYTAGNKFVADSFAGTTGDQIKVAIPKTAKILDYTELENAQRRGQHGERQATNGIIYDLTETAKKDGVLTSQEESAARSILNNATTKAIQMGYDVISVPPEIWKRALNSTDGLDEMGKLEPYYVVLNRGVVVVEEA